MRAGYPNEIVGVDIMGPITESLGRNRYIIVMVDYFTKWAEAVAVQTIDTSSVARVIFDNWIAQWGAPTQLHTDRGGSFESSTIYELCKLMQIDKTRTTAYHPQGNGLVERTNRTLINLLQAMVEETQLWDQALKKCIMAYRSTVHTSTGQTPHLMWTGREMRIPCDLRAPYAGRIPMVNTEYVVTLKDDLIKSHELARKHLSTQQRKQKEYYDRSTHGKPLEVGDQVYLHSEVPAPGVPAKLSRRWKGPYVVHKALSEVLYEIRNPQRPTESIVVHFNRLKPAPEEQLRPTTQPQSDIPEVGAEAEIPIGGGIARYRVGTS